MLQKGELVKIVVLCLAENRGVISAPSPVVKLNVLLGFMAGQLRIVATNVNINLLLPVDVHNVAVNSNMRRCFLIPNCFTLSRDSHYTHVLLFTLTNA